MKKLLLYNHGGCENRGCEAIARSTSALFAEQAGAQCRMDSLQAAYDRRIGLPHIARIDDAQISSHSFARIVNSIAFRLGQPREDEIARKYQPVIRAGKQSDICLSIGGDTYCYGWQEHLTIINKRLKAAGKPLVLWGCSIDPERLEGQTLTDLRAYDLIVARESITEAAMRAVGLPVMRWCDPAFLLPKEELPLPEGWRKDGTIGLNVSPLVLSRTPDRAKAVDAFEQLIRTILDESPYSVALIPHVTWAHDNDMDALAEIKARFAEESRVFILPGTLNAVQYKGYIARLTALVTARTHASVAAYSTGVPTLVIGYSVKARGIARDIFGDETGHLIPAQELSGADELIGAFEALIRRGAQERAYLAAKMPEYTAGKEKVVQSVMQLEGKQ